MGFMLLLMLLLLLLLLLLMLLLMLLQVLLEWLGHHERHIQSVRFGSEERSWWQPSGAVLPRLYVRAAAASRSENCNNLGQVQTRTGRVGGR